MTASPTDPPGHPQIDTVALERLAVGAWVPDVVASHDGWLLRAADGFTGRANSALVLHDPGPDLPAVLAAVQRWYREQELPPMLAVPLPTMTGVVHAAVAAGWSQAHGGRVMIRAADLAPVADGHTVRVTATPDEAWLGCRSDAQTLPPAGHRLLTRGDTVAFASSVVDGEVVAIARGAASQGWLGVNAVETIPDHRRQGHATAVMAALATWARQRDVQRIFLQVDLANDRALTVYERAGFVDHHTYRYLAAPDQSRN